MPYWDYTIDSIKVEFDAGRAQISSIFKDSELFAEDFFGETDSDAHRVTVGRFAQLLVPRNDEFEVKSPYGFLRAPWNINPSKFVTRYHKVCDSDVISTVRGTSGGRPYNWHVPIYGVALSERMVAFMFLSLTYHAPPPFKTKTKNAPIQQQNSTESTAMTEPDVAYLCVALPVLQHGRGRTRHVAHLGGHGHVQAAWARPFLGGRCGRPVQHIRRPAYAGEPPHFGADRRVEARGLRTPKVGVAVRASEHSVLLRRETRL